ncbi:MAG: cytochrome P460 family protein [Myxococcota bacterium]
MKINELRTRIHLMLAGVCLLALVVASGPGFAAKNGEDDLSLPKNFRTSMTHLGSWFVPEGDASGFHDVYMTTSSVDAYRRTGKFPEGTKLVKELRPSEAGTYTTGSNVSHATDGIKQWFVMVKDGNGSGKGPNYGDGWGWALYKPDDPDQNVSPGYKDDIAQGGCISCHIPARQTDYVYVEAYPTLRKTALGR